MTSNICPPTFIINNLKPQTSNPQCDDMYFNLLQSQKLSTLTQQTKIHLYSLLNSKIKALVQQQHYLQALQVYTKEPYFPLNTSKFTFPSLLKACSSLSKLNYGKAIHATIIQMGLQYDPYITTSLINMCTKCGFLCIAQKVFDNMLTLKCELLGQDVTIWNSMIDGLFRNGVIEEGLSHFRLMQKMSVKPDGYSLSILLGVFDDCNLSLLKGMEIHGYAVRNMFDDDPFVVTALIEMYSNTERLMDAWRVFEKLADKKNIVVWNAMINGFCEHALWIKSLELYSLVKNEGCRLVSATFASALSACSQGEDLEFGSQVHSDVVKLGFESDPYSCTSLLTMYGKCGVIKDVYEVFCSVKNKEVEIWNAMISAYVSNGYYEDALTVYHQMRLKEIPSDSFTISNVLTSCSATGLYCLGRALHGELIKRPIQNNIAVQSSLLTMYSRSSSIHHALGIFNSMKEKDVVVWGSMISGYCQNGKFTEALDLFQAMDPDSIKLDPNLIANVINACAGLRSSYPGCSIHTFVIKCGLESDAFVGSSLIDFYSKCGQPKRAGNVFAGITSKNLVIWNSLMSCYCQNGLSELSLGLLPQIMEHGLCPDCVSITNALVAVSSDAALLRGKAIHCYHIRLHIPDDIQVENALIDMYIKSGCLGYAQLLFQNMSERNLVTWNSMIAGHGTHGECLKAMNLFSEMQDSGIKPDDVTFLSLISSCNHSGLVDEGLKLLHLMLEYKIEPRMEHYVNIVDLLGRAKRLDEAFTFIQNMPIESDRSIWLSLLSACRVHCNVELGEIAGQNLINLDPSTGSNYVQLLNLYVEAGLQEKAANLRASMRHKGLKKIPGCSWIEVKNKVDVFHASDCSCSRTVEIYETLNSLRNNMKRRQNYHKAVEAL